jgi:hypothetical protein
MACLFVTLCKYELASKHASMQLRRLKRRLAGDEGLVPLERSAAPQQPLMPALPLDDAGPYVAAAYLVFLALVLIYVSIMATKLGADLARDRRAERDRRAPRGAAETRDREPV